MVLVRAAVARWCLKKRALIAGPVDGMAGGAARRGMSAACGKFCLSRSGRELSRY